MERLECTYNRGMTYIEEIEGINRQQHTQAWKYCQSVSHASDTVSMQSRSGKIKLERKGVCKYKFKEQV